MFSDFLLTEPIVTSISVRLGQFRFIPGADLLCSYGSVSLGGCFIA